MIKVTAGIYYMIYIDTISNLYKVHLLYFYNTADNFILFTIVCCHNTLAVMYRHKTLYQRSRLDESISSWYLNLPAALYLCLNLRIDSPFSNISRIDISSKWIPSIIMVLVFIKPYFNCSDSVWCETLNSDFSI